MGKPSLSKQKGKRKFEDIMDVQGEDSKIDDEMDIKVEDMEISDDE